MYSFLVVDMVVVVVEKKLKLVWDGWRDLAGMVVEIGLVTR